MTTENIFIDKTTKLKGRVIDVSTKPGSVEVYVKLENGETVTRKINELIFQAEEVK